MCKGRALDLLCIGEPMLEFNLQGIDASRRRTYVEAFGGDASNVAVAAARQGARVGLVSAVGDDAAGRSFAEMWHREGVDASGVRVDRRAFTGVYFVTHDGGGHAFSYLREGSAASLFRPDQLPRESIAASSMLFAAGISLAISASAADAVFEAMDMARSAGRTIAFDTNYRPRLWPPRRAAAVMAEAARLTRIIFPGVEDARAMLGIEDPDKILDTYLTMEVEIVGLKMGAAGSIVASARSRQAIPPFPCRPIDATGAGDTFCGGFLAAFAKDQDAVAAARYASCAAALSTTGYGAVQPMPRKAEVLAALDAHDASERPLDTTNS